MRMSMDELLEGEARVRLEGVLDRETVPEVRRRLLRVARGERFKRLWIDLSRVDRLDTAGVAVMVEILQAVSRRGGKLCLDGLGDEAKRLFRLARLDRLFGMDGQSVGGA